MVSLSDAHYITSSLHLFLPHSPIRVLITQLSYHLPRLVTIHEKTENKQMILFCWYTSKQFLSEERDKLRKESWIMMMIEMWWKKFAFGVIKQLGIIRLTHKDHETISFIYIIYSNSLFLFFQVVSKSLNLKYYSCVQIDCVRNYIFHHAMRFLIEQTDVFWL